MKTGSNFHVAKRAIAWARLLVAALTACKNKIISLPLQRTAMEPSREAAGPHVEPRSTRPHFSCENPSQRSGTGIWAGLTDDEDEALQVGYL